MSDLVYSNKGLQLKSFNDLKEWAECVVASGFAPKGFDAASVIVATQFGAEVGLSPMQSLQSIMVVNNRPAIWGDGMLALCMAHPAFVDIEEYFEGDQETLTAICKVHRRGCSVKTGTFSVAQAKRAGLWEKDLWKKYPRRMLQSRARSFGLRDAFPDSLKGLVAYEEAVDYEPIASPPKHHVVEFKDTAVQDSWDNTVKAKEDLRQLDLNIDNAIKPKTDKKQIFLDAVESYRLDVGDPEAVIGDLGLITEDKMAEATVLLKAEIARSNK